MPFLFHLWYSNLFCPIPVPVRTILSLRILFGRYMWRSLIQGAFVGDLFPLINICHVNIDMRFWTFGLLILPFYQFGILTLTTILCYFNWLWQLRFGFFVQPLLSQWFERLIFLVSGCGKTDEPTCLVN